MLTAPRGRNDFKVAIICASPLEAENVQCVFDKCWEDEGKQYGKAVGDQNSYNTGVIGNHDVVLVHMPGTGSNSAALSAAGLRLSFPDVKLALVVGICGVVPVHAKTKEEIVLGDVVISTALAQYDFGRQYPHGFERKKGIEDSLGIASPEIRAFVNMLQTRPNRRRLTRNLAQLVHSNAFQQEIPAAEYPGASRDRLYEPSYVHHHRLDKDCDRCRNQVEVCSKSCDDLGCEDGRLIIRERHAIPGTQTTGPGPDYSPSIHLGRFGSANIVMRSGVDRDRIAADEEVIAFEMEGAGVWEQHPTIVIKAACSYADSHQSKDWRGYAAAMAAACLKVVLKEWNVAEQPLSSANSKIPSDRVSGFSGRESEVVEGMLLDPSRRRLVSVVGLGAMGKNPVASQFVHHVQSRTPEHSILWVQPTLEKDMFDVGEKLKIQGVEDDKADDREPVTQCLGDRTDDEWLLVRDIADGQALWWEVSDQ